MVDRPVKTPLDEEGFDRIAEAELLALERTLGESDPDELDVELSHDVLRLTLGDGQEIVINRHRAARQIWMAAMRRAWHFSPVAEEGSWKWRAGEGELHIVLNDLLRSRLGRDLL